MTLTDQIDAQLAQAQHLGARPFRLELSDLEIEQLHDAGVLEDKPNPQDSCSGVYRDVKVYPAGKVSQLMAQPADPTELRAVHLPLK